MAWRDRLLPGSFRGAAFEIEAHQFSGGRRVQVHEYPGRDVPFPEDLGRRAREYQVECYVIDPDYMGPRNRLLAACEAAGPATLVHPYLGTRRAQCTGVKVRESAKEGGMATFTLSFVDAGANRYPVAEADTADAVGQFAAEAEQALAGQFAERFVL